MMTLEYRKLFGGRLKLARKRAGLTSEQAAEALGVVRQAVVSWESGRNYPTIDHLKEVASLYRVSSNWLLYEENYSTPKTDRFKPKLRIGEESYSPSYAPDVRVMFEEVSRASGQDLSPEDMKTVIDLIEFLKQRKRIR